MTPGFPRRDGAGTACRVGSVMTARGQPSDVNDSSACRPSLLGSFWTLAVGADPLGDQRCLHDFRKRVEIAARAGFAGMGFWHRTSSRSARATALRT